MIAMVGQDTRRLVVYTDGSCPFCQWSRQQVERYDRQHLVEFRDYNDPAVARETPFADAQLATEMHVLTPEQRWYGGYSAWLEVLKALPRWRWLGKLLGYVPQSVSSAESHIALPGGAAALSAGRDLPGT